MRFLTHISVAVAPANARCTNICTCRKGSVIALPTNRKLTENEETMPTRKIATTQNITARGTSSHGGKGREEKKTGGHNGSG